MPYEIPLECGQDSAVIPIIIVWAAFVNTFRRVCGGISVICKFFYRFVFFAEKQEKMAVLKTLRSDGVQSGNSVGMALDVFGKIIVAYEKISTFDAKLCALHKQCEI